MGVLYTVVSRCKGICNLNISRILKVYQLFLIAVFSEIKPIKGCRERPIVYMYETKNEISRLKVCMRYGMLLLYALKRVLR